MGGPPRLLQRGEAVVLVRPGSRAVWAEVREGPQPLDDAGVVDLAGVVGRPPGTVVNWLGEEWRAVRPSLSDRLGRLRRGAQIVLPKDAFRMAALAGLGAGSRVLEAGVGSGALTIVLAHLVGEDGAVRSYDRREDFLRLAKSNVERAGYAARVEFRHRDVTRDGFDEGDADAVLLDLPEPWAVAAAVRDALVPGGGVAALVPTYNQLERAVRSFREAGFEEVQSLEVLERPMHVGDGGTRPSFEMLGHTGFLIGGRRLR